MIVSLSNTTPQSLLLFKPHCASCLPVLIYRTSPSLPFFYLALHLSLTFLKEVCQELPLIPNEAFPTLQPLNTSSTSHLYSIAFFLVLIFHLNKHLHLIDGVVLARELFVRSHPASLFSCVSHLFPGPVLLLLLV